MFGSSGCQVRNLCKLLVRSPTLRPHLLPRAANSGPMDSRGCACARVVFLIQINPTMNHSCMYFHGLYNLSLFLALIHEPFYPFTDCIGLLRLVHHGMSTRGRSSCWDCETEGSGATAPETVLQALTKVWTRADDRVERKWIKHEPSEMSSAEKKRMKKRVLRRKKRSRRSG